MKIVTEISEKDYRNFLLQYESGILDEKTPSHRAKIAIANGTPLPSGHGRLIDADALKKKAVMCPTVGNAETILLDISDVENAPTIIEADKEQGEEEKKQPCGKCIHFNRCWEEREFMYIETDKDGKCPRYKEGAEE